MHNLEFSKWHSIEGVEGCHRRARDLLLPARNKARGRLSSSNSLSGSSRDSTLHLPHINVSDIQRNFPYFSLWHKDILHSMPHSPSSPGHKPHAPYKHLYLPKLLLFYPPRVEQGLLLVDRPWEGTRMTQARTVSLALIHGNFTTKAIWHMESTWK